MNDADAASAPSAAPGAYKLAALLPPALLSRRCDPAELPFDVCSDLEAPPGAVG